MLESETNRSISYEHTIQDRSEEGCWLPLFPPMYRLCVNGSMICFFHRLCVPYLVPYLFRSRSLGRSVGPV